MKIFMLAAMVLFFSSCAAYVTPAPTVVYYPGHDYYVVHGYYGDSWHPYHPYYRSRW